MLKRTRLAAAFLVAALMMNIAAPTVSALQETEADSQPQSVAVSEATSAPEAAPVSDTSSSSVPASSEAPASSDDASPSEGSSSSEQLSSSALSDASSVENSSSIDMLTADKNQITDATYTNPNSRYYYNLETGFNSNALQFEIAAGVATVDTPQKLMLWSILHYADTSLRSYFNSQTGITSYKITGGSLDMTGFSYYPVNSSDTNINNAKITFDNATIETAEANNCDVQAVRRKR